MGARVSPRSAKKAEPVQLGLTPEQLDQRKRGLGATDVAALSGLHPYKNAHDVWMEKTERRQPGPMNHAMELGLQLEPIVAERYHGLLPEGETLEASGTKAHPSLSWLMATPDRLVVRYPDPEQPYAFQADKKELVRLLEIKTAGHRSEHRWGATGTDEIPEEYLAQCAIQMAVFRVERVDVAALLLGCREFRTYPVKRDAELEEILIEKADHFWHKCVLTDTPPAYDGSDAASKALALRFPRSTERRIAADRDLGERVRQYRLARQNREFFEKQEEHAKQLIQDAMGDAGLLEGAGFEIAWRSTRGRTEVNWEKVAEWFKEYVPEKAWAEKVAESTTTAPGYRRFTARFDE